MILVLKGADFSANNIGKIDLPRELSDFTKAALSASGNTSLSDEQKLALDNFFINIGAVSNTGIWRKIKVLFLPILAADKERAFTNYVGNTRISATLSNWDFADGALKAIDNSAGSSVRLFESVKFDFTDTTVGFYDNHGMYENGIHFVVQAGGTHSQAVIFAGTGGVQTNMIFNHYPIQNKRTIIVDPQKNFSAGRMILATIKDSEAFGLTRDNKILTREVISDAASYQDGEETLSLGYGGKLISPYMDFKAFIYGSAFTTDEAITFKQNIDTLISALS